MPVPSAIGDLSTTPGSNFPLGSENPATFDDYMRTFAAFIAQLRDGKQDGALSVLLAGDQTVNGVKTFSSAPVVPDASFALTKIATIATARILGRDTSGAGAIEELTAAEVLTMLGISALVPTGLVAPFARTTAPSGWLALPTAASNVSRATYADLFAAIGTTWGAGDGSTTFGLPFLPENYAPLGTAASVGTSTVGQVIAHAHAVPVALNSSVGAFGSALSASQAADFVGNPSGSQGGSANIAAGVRFLYCIKL